MSTFAVNMTSREFNPDDKECHLIKVSADLSDESAFFALSEYLAYAASEIEQCHRWAAFSEATSDGRGFSFPWRGVEPDIHVGGQYPRQMRFEWIEAGFSRFL